jgi:hypothetical protein
LKHRLAYAFLLAGFVLIPLGVLAAQTNLVFLPLALRGYPLPPETTPTPTETPPAQGVSILPNHTAALDSSGYLHLWGEVQNATGDHLRYVEINASFYDGSGALLDSEFTNTLLDNVPPGEKACFDLFIEEPAGWATYEFAAPVYWTDGAPLPKLALLNDRGSYDPDLDWYTITGQVRNDQGSRVEYVSPVATYYNAAGRVVGCDFSFLENINLGPGQTGSFELNSSTPLAAAIKTYRIQISGETQ